MNCLKADKKLLERICCSNVEAMDFLANHWSPYVHEIDDIVDGDRTSPEEILSTFARAPMLYSHPFYLKNLLGLRQIVLLCNNVFADSVLWEKSDVPWKKQWSDHSRHVAMEMVVAVAQICGGYEHGRIISQEQRNVCWHEHHTPEGASV